MKKTLLALLSALALMVGGVFTATAAQAASNSTQNWSLSTCNVQYKDFNGVIRTLVPSQFSVYSVWMVRVPVGCHGAISRPGATEFILTGGTWKSFTSMFPSGTHTVTQSYKN